MSLFDNFFKLFTKKLTYSPSTPVVTPNIVKHGITLGTRAYYTLNAQNDRTYVNVIDVREINGDFLVKFFIDDFHSVTLSTVALEKFMIKYHRNDEVSHPLTDPPY